MKSIVIMGVAGCGKSSVGARLAAATGMPLVEGDDHHSPANRSKMQQGIALTDADREGWLATLSEQIRLHRRAERELGLTVTDVREAIPEFRYRAVDASGIVENEICPVYIARAVGEPNPAADEVAEYHWADTLELLAAVTATPWAFSPWLTLQLPELAARGLL